MKGMFIGITAIDLIYPLDHFPEEDSKTNVSDHLIHLGGPATNAAITFAALGGDATLISAIGESSWTAFIRERLRQYGVHHIDLAEGTHFKPTISSILVNQSSGFRTVVTSKEKELEYQIQADEKMDKTGLWRVRDFQVKIFLSPNSCIFSYLEKHLSC